MATLATQNVTRLGVTPAYAAATGGGDKFRPSKDTYLHVKNASGGAITITIVTARTDALGNAVADNAISVTAAQERMIGPFPAEHYASSVDGLADITYSGVTSFTIGAFEIGQP